MVFGQAPQSPQLDMNLDLLARRCRPATAQRVVIADDDSVSRLVLSRSLRQMGLEVIETADGQAALEAVTEGQARLLITDWEMPGLNGIELCERIRATTLPSYVYIIVLSQRQKRGDVVAGLDAGADDFLTKPFYPAELEVRVRAGQRVLTLQSRDVTIFALARLAEARDPETGAHLERTRSYVQALARYLRDQGLYPDMVDDEFVRLIYLTAPLHDIGKVAIPDSVLLKPGRLNDDEFDVMKQHTLHGAQTLEAALRQYPHTAYLWMARDIVLSHHERWDGSGYPYGLVGEQIPLAGRIMSVADVYDALVSRRVYKDAFTHAMARSMIVEQRGRQFDPVLVDAFEACESQFQQIHAAYQHAEVDAAVAQSGGDGRLF